MKLHSQKIQYGKYNWDICGDLKITALSAWLADWLHNVLLRSVWVGQKISNSKTLSWTRIGYQGQKDVVNTP